MFQAGKVGYFLYTSGRLNNRPDNIRKENSQHAKLAGRKDEINKIAG